VDVRTNDRLDLTHGVSRQGEATDTVNKLGFGAKAHAANPLGKKALLIRGVPPADLPCPANPGSVIEPQRGETDDAAEIKHLSREIEFVPWIEQVIGAPEFVGLEAGAIEVIEAVGWNPIPDDLYGAGMILPELVDL